MKFLKAACCIALCCTVLLIAYVICTANESDFAAAQTNAPEAARYAYADTDSEVYFYSLENKTALFVIPQTYCVQILGREGEWLRVRYAEDEGLFVHIDGYCRAESLKECDEPLENLYLKRTVTITYAPSETPPAPLSPPKVMEFAAAYYGSFKVGDVDCMYVYVDGNFCYVTGTIGYYEKNELPEDLTPAFATDGEGVNAALICALVLTFVAAAAIVIIYFTGKRKTPKS